jgi:hypothetical protein
MAQGCEIIEPGVTTSLIGNGGWADGLGGLGPATPRRVADFKYINDLSALANDDERFSWMRNFAHPQQGTYTIANIPMFR